MSVFARKEDAPAFNFLLRVLTPIIYLIIASAILYSFKLDYLVKDFYLVSIYYLTFRLLFNLITGRGLLLNWKQQILYWILIIAFSYFVYIKLLSDKRNILPDFETLANELWIIIIIFLYQTFNNINLSSNGTQIRKDRYLKEKYQSFKDKYGDIINEKTDCDLIKGLIYSVLILENFNRPKAIRIVENLKFYLTKKPHSLGVMQYYSSEFINDRKSVELGTEKIVRESKEIIEKYKRKEVEYYGEYPLKRDLSGIYNTGHSYKNDVSELWSDIMTNFYPDSKRNILD